MQPARKIRRQILKEYLTTTFKDKHYRCTPLLPNIFSLESCWDDDSNWYSCIQVSYCTKQNRLFTFIEERKDFCTATAGKLLAMKMRQDIWSLETSAWRGSAQAMYGMRVFILSLSCSMFIALCTTWNREKLLIAEQRDQLLVRGVSSKRGTSFGTQVCKNELEGICGKV